MSDDLTVMGIAATAAAAMGREQIVLAHQAEHPLAGNPDVATDPKPSPDLAVALALPGRCLQVGFDRHQQRLVRDRGLRSPTLCRRLLGVLAGGHGVERGAGHAPGGADPPQAVGQTRAGRGGGTHHPHRWSTCRFRATTHRAVQHRQRPCIRARGTVMASMSNDDRSISDPPGAAAPKVDPEELALRAKPRPVTRINRRVLILLSGTGLLLIFGATIFALDPPNLFDRDSTGTELYNVDNKPTPEGLDSLPRRYSDLPKPFPKTRAAATRRLRRRRSRYGTRSWHYRSANLPFRPNPEEDAARAERIRQARIAQQANESGVFFQLSTRNAAAPSPGAVPGGQSQTPAGTSPNSGPASRNPFEVARAGDANGPLELDLQNDQNLQGRKLDFLKLSCR